MTLDGLRAYVAGKAGDSEAGQAVRALIRERDTLKEQIRQLLERIPDAEKLRADRGILRAHNKALTAELARLRAAQIPAASWEGAEF